MKVKSWTGLRGHIFILDIPLPSLIGKPLKHIVHFQRRGEWSGWHQEWYRIWNAEECKRADDPLSPSLLHPNLLRLFSFSLSFLSLAFLCTLPSVSFLSLLSSPSIIRTSHKPSEGLDTGLSRWSLNVLQWQLGRGGWRVGNPLAAPRRDMVLFSLVLCWGQFYT